MAFLLRAVTVRGQAGRFLVGGYREAAWLRTWVITCSEDRVWTLEAAVERVDTFQLRGRDKIAFTAPRIHGHKGFWFFPVFAASIVIAGQTLTAKLGPPEQ